MKMVQLSLALACLLAGADAFAPIPHHTHEEPDTHEVPHHHHALSPSPSPPPSAPVVIVPKFSEFPVKCARSQNDFPAWTLSPGSFARTAKECWEECQAELSHGEQNTGANPNPVPSHQFLVITGTGPNAGATECFCKTSCDCFDENTNTGEEDDTCKMTPDENTCYNQAGCCFNYALEICEAAVGPCSSRRLADSKGPGEEEPAPGPGEAEEPAAHTTLALPDWEGCTAPVIVAPKLSVHTGSCQYKYHSKQWQDLAAILSPPENTAEECWASCGKWMATANEGEMVDYVLTLDFRENVVTFDDVGNVAPLTTSCTCKADCSCWITADSWNKYAGYEPGTEYYNLEAGTMTTIAEPNWEPPNKCT